MQHYSEPSTDGEKKKVKKWLISVYENEFLNAKESERSDIWGAYRKAYEEMVISAFKEYIAVIQIDIDKITDKESLLKIWNVVTFVNDCCNDALKYVEETFQFPESFKGELPGDMIIKCFAGMFPNIYEKIKAVI